MSGGEGAGAGRLETGRPPLISCSCLPHIQGDCRNLNIKQTKVFKGLTAAILILKAKIWKGLIIAISN